MQIAINPWNIQKQGGSKVVVRLIVIEIAKSEAKSILALIFRLEFVDCCVVFICDLLYSRSTC
jgi:hypothetical protein